MGEVQSPLCNVHKDQDISWYSWFYEQIDKVKPFLKAIDEQFETFDKALTSTLIMQFSSTNHTGIRAVHDYIMHMRDTVAQLKSLEVTMSDTFLVHYILNTLVMPQNLGFS